MRSFIIFTLFSFAGLQADWLQSKFKLGFGPAWASEWGDLRYTLTGSGAEGTTQNRFLYNPGPWIDGGIQAKICDYVIVDIYGGGGWIRNGFGNIIQKALVSHPTGGAPLSSIYDEYDTKITCNFLTTFAGGGLCYNHKDLFFISLTAGYAFNAQKWHSVQFNAPYTHLIKNKWKSPYVGIEGSWNICDCLKFDVNYRALIGHASSYDKVSLNGNQLSNTCRFVPKFFGNLVALNLMYQFAECWHTDFSVLYNSFASLRRGCATPQNTSTQINQFFNRLRFNMIALTLSIGYNY